MPRRQRTFSAPTLRRFVAWPEGAKFRRSSWVRTGVFGRRTLLRWIDEHHLQRQPPCVLVVEDEEISRELVKNFLEEKGFRVLMAWDGREGLA